VEVLGDRQGWGEGADLVGVESVGGSFHLRAGQVQSGSHIYFFLFFSFSVWGRWRRDLYLASER